MTSVDTASVCRNCREPICYRRRPSVDEEPRWWHRSGMAHCRSTDPTDTRVAEPEEVES